MTKVGHWTSGPFRLTHSAPWRTGLVTGCLSALCALLLPYLHIGVIHRVFWVPDKPEVDRENCTCSCFDTIFKGTYMNIGSVGYMHLYFNATANSFKIWLLSAVGLLLFYEAFRHILTLALQSRLRLKWLWLFVLGIYPNYYGFWNLFNYYNDEFYPMFNQQIYFSLTELTMSAVVVRLCDTNKEVECHSVLLIFCISLVHLVVGGADQFFHHLIKGQGRAFLKHRDLSLVTPDLLFLTVASLELRRLHKRKNFISFKLFLFVCAAVIFGVIVGRSL